MSNGVNSSNVVWRGARGASEDFFDDLMEVPAVDGSMFSDSAGLRDYDSLRETQTADGVEVKMHCRACPASAVITMSWDELYAVAEYPVTGLRPAGWDVSTVNLTLYPEVHCKQCGAVCAPQVKPAWAKKQLDDAMQRDPTIAEKMRGSRLVAAVIAAKQQRQPR